MSHRILSQRLIIRPFLSDDVTDAYLGWLNDREFMRYSRQRLRTHTRDSCEDYLRGFVGSPNFFWNVALRDEGLQLGTATAYVDPASSVSDVGLLIGHSGHGYGTEAFGAVIAYLFEIREVRKITAGTLSLNRAMVGIALRWGMLREGRLREQEKVGNEWADIYRYGLLRREWMDLEQRSRITVEIFP